MKMTRRNALHATAAGLAGAMTTTALTGCGHVEWHALPADVRGARPNELLDKVYRAHGGVEAWQRSVRIDGTLSTGGTAFSMRGQDGKVQTKQVSVFPRQFKTIINDYPTAGFTGIWEGDKVSILAANGSTPPQSREQARKHFEQPEAGRAWDDLDLLYFVGYALWNYLSFPFILLDERIAVSQSESKGQPMLDVQFPLGFPTHSQQQHFMLNADGTLRRHDYVAEVFASWASAANFCDRAETIGGLRVYTRRHVVPALGRSASLPFPTLVWIELDKVSVVTQT